MSKKNILVSILINNYNNKPYIKNCIQSCLKQSYKKFELIIYDDNSDDGSKQIIKKINNKKIKKIFNNKKIFKGGPLNQLNSIYKSLPKSKGKLIFLLDGDDFFLKNKLYNIIKIFKKNKNLKFIQDSPYYYYPEKNIKIKKSLKNKFFTLHTWPYFFPTSTMAFERNFLKKVLKELKFSGKKYPRMFFDARAMIYIYFFEKKFLKINQCLTMYTQNIKGDTIKNYYNRSNLNWWRRRYEYHMFVNSLFKKKGKFHFKFLDYYLTVLINTLFK